MYTVNIWGSEGIIEGMIEGKKDVFPLVAYIRGFMSNSIKKSWKNSIAQSNTINLNSDFLFDYL